MTRIFCCLFFLAACAGSRQQLNTPIVREGPAIIAARASAPTPPEVVDELQARQLACEAAAMIGQTALLDHALKKKAASGEPLAEAEIPHIKVQERLRTLIRSAHVAETTVRKNFCTVTISINKSELKTILKEAK